MRVFATVVAVAILAAGAAVGASAKHERPRSSGSPGVVAAAGGSFVSLWAPRSLHGTAVERFSLGSGRPLGALFTEHAGAAAPGLSEPHVDGSGTVWVTAGSGPACIGAGFECGGLKPNSCRSKVLKLSPGGGPPQTALTFPDSELVGDGVPSPDGEEVALVTAGCTTSYFDSHYVVRDLESGRQWTLGSGARPCHSLSSPAWNATGTELVFTYGVSTLPQGQQPPTLGGSPACTAPSRDGIVVAAADRSSTAASWHVIAHQPGCNYETAAFDRAGIVAFEACAPTPTAPADDDFLGPAYVVQLDTRGRLLFRLPLEVGANPGSVASNPDTGEVLVTQDQTYNDSARPGHQPAYNYVWQLAGRHLRLIVRFPFNGQLVIAGQPS